MKLITLLCLSFLMTSSFAYDSSHMERTRLYGVCQSCDLSGGDFRGRNLSGVDFSFSNLSDANFHGATLNGTNLSGANLSGAVWPDGRICQQGSVGNCL